jgi:hypothetical protein
MISRRSPFINRRRHVFMRKVFATLFAGMIDMDFRTVRRHVILLVCIAFELVILYTWWSAILDLPGRFYGAPPRVFRWQEPAMLTVWLVLLMLFVIAVLIVFFRQIRYLEGFLPVCSFCKSIRAGEAWVPIEEYMREHTALKMTHSLCPRCAKEHYGYVEDEEEYIEVGAGEGE